MRDIANGTIYDTAAAELVFTWRSHPAGDQRRREQNLYRTARGRWFIRCYHGSRSDMAMALPALPNVTAGVEHIQPITPGAAMSFLERHHAIVALERWFGPWLVEA